MLGSSAIASEALKNLVLPGEAQTHFDPVFVETVLNGCYLCDLSVFPKGFELFEVVWQMVCDFLTLGVLSVFFVYKQFKF